MYKNTVTRKILIMKRFNRIAAVCLNRRLGKIFQTVLVERSRETKKPSDLPLFVEQRTKQTFSDYGT